MEKFARIRIKKRISYCLLTLGLIIMGCERHTSAPPYAPDSADIFPGTDFRFLPDAWKVEPSGGMSQFGLAFDAAGNRFTV